MKKPAGAGKTSGGSEEEARIVELPAVPEATPSTMSKPVGIIEIDIGGARVRLHGQVDESNVRCVLHTLRGLA